MTVQGQSVALGGPVQRRLLAALIAHAPNPVPSEILVDDVWGESAPPTAVRTLHSHVARLRDALGRDSGHSIETVDGSYRLPLQRSDVDAWVFEDLVRSATSNGSSPAESAEILSRALGLWRGPAYGDFAGAAFADAESRRLDSLRDRALEAKVEADLAGGKGAELVPELEALVIEHPFRERLWSALIIALYRSGRQADALDAFQRARAILGDELGVDPGPELRAVEAKVLAQDPSLLVAAPARVHTCPWKGLASYEPGDADFFVGRDAIVSEVIARLVDYSVVIVTGPSGSGKSSLVRAGVMPALADGAIIGSRGWRVTLLSPGDRPLDAVRGALADGPDLLVLDPGDDLLAVAGTDELGPIADTLRAAVATGTRIVMTLRGDLFGRLTELNALAPRAGAGTVLVGPPSDDELRQVVQDPARRVGLDVEPALVDAVVSDVRGRPAALPLLSTALVRTWERREHGRLTLAGYVAAGGAASALERLAEEAYASMDDDERLAARRILLRLVVNDDGLWRRRRLSIDEAAPAGDDAAERALRVLSDHRLVSLDVGEVQLSHEALTGAWPRFASWLAEREQTAGVFDHLTTSALAWQAGGRDDADLYRGTRLQAAVDLESSRPDDLGPVEREFIARSRGAGDRELTSLRRGRRRLMLVAGALVLLLAVASFAGVLAVQGRNDAAEAARQADAQRVGLQALGRSDVSQKLLLAVAAVRLHANAGTEASLLAALQEAGGAAMTVPLTAPAQTLAVSTDGWIGVGESNGHVEAFPPQFGTSDDQMPAGSWTGGASTNVVAWLSGHDAMLVGAVDPARVVSMNPHNGGVSTFATGWSPTVFTATGDEAWVAGVSDSPPTGPGAQLLGQRSDDTTTRVRVPLAADPTAMFPGPGSTVTVVERGTVQRVDLARAEVTSTVSVPVTALVVASTDGRLAAASSPDGSVELVDLQTGASSQRIPNLGTGLAAMALSPDGSLLAGVEPRGGLIRVWSTSNGVERASFTSDLGHVHAVAWAPDGTRLYTTPTSQAGLQVWDLSHYASPVTRVAAASPAGAGKSTVTAVDPTTRTLAVGTDEGRAWFLDIDSGTAHVATGPARPAIVSVAFADDGRLALTADAGGMLTLWDPSTGQRVADLTAPTRVEGLSDVSRAPVSPDGRTAASFIDGYGLRLVDVVSRTIGPPVYPDLGNKSEYEVLGWSPDGRYVVVGAQGIGFRPAAMTPGVWALVDPRDGRVVWRTDAPEQIVAADVAFAEDGRTIVVPGQSGRLYFLDAGSGALPSNGGAAVEAPAVNDRQTPASVSVSPDGRHLSVVSEAHPVEIWDVASGVQGGTIDVPAGTVAAHYLSNSELVTTTVDGAVSAHDLTVSDWVGLACQAAGRELTTTEWNQFLAAYPYEPVCSSSERNASS